MDPITLAAIAAATAGAQSLKKKGEFQREGRNAALQSAWSGLSGGPMGQLTMERPNLLMDTAAGFGKGYLGGYGMETERMKALNPQGSATVINTTNTPVEEAPMSAPTAAPAPLGFAPITPRADSRFGQEMNDVYDMQSKHTASMPFWMYGGTGSSKLQAQKNKAHPSYQNKSAWSGVSGGW